MDTGDITLDKNLKIQENISLQTDKALIRLNVNIILRLQRDVAT